MAGYFENAEATAQTIDDGWLHTGDLGRFDADGNLFIVGRKKEMILGAAAARTSIPTSSRSSTATREYVKELVGRRAAGRRRATRRSRR